MANINWYKIKEKIFSYCKNGFKDQNINVSDGELTHCIDVFYNVINKKIWNKIDGLGNELLSALQVSCCDNPYSYSDFRAIKTDIDPFLKKILLLTGKAVTSDIDGLGTKKLFVLTGVIPSYTMSSPRITQANVDSFKGSIDGMYFWAYSDYCRNEVHESPDMDLSAISYGLKYLLSFYIFMIYRCLPELVAKNPNIEQKSYSLIEEDNSGRLYYDFINYGKASNALKNRFINSYVFEKLYIGSEEKSDLINQMIKFSNNSLSLSSASRILDKLVSNSRISISASGQVSLVDNEKERLSEAYSNYSERVNHFLSQLEDLISDYSLTCKKNDLFADLKLIFENNYNTDLLEINDDCNIPEVDSVLAIQTKLSSCGCAEESVKMCTMEILRICKSNDVLIRLGMAKLFSKISNPDTFNNYANKTTRKVYIDTQLVLYALCVNMDLGNCDNYRYLSVKNLLNSATTRSNSQIIYSKHYLSEVTNHLRQALLLIPFADRYRHIKQKISSNVFYQFYYEMRDRDQLPEKVESFADFLSYEFNMEEADAFTNTFGIISSSIIEDKLEKEIGFTLEDIPGYQEDSIEHASDIFKNFASKNKVGTILKNDSIMGLHLFSTPSSVPNPFFLTWDSSFTSFRKKYIEKYKRTKHLCWHLFTPSKYVNHIDLLNFKVDVNSLTDDFLSILEADDNKGQTSYIIDKFNKILDISGMDEQKRRKYISIISDEVLNEQDFPNEIEESSESAGAGKIADVLDEVIEHYKDAGNESLKHYTNLILDDAFFIKLISMAKKSIEDIPTVSKNDIIFCIDKAMSEDGKN